MSSLPIAGGAAAGEFHFGLADWMARATSHGAAVVLLAAMFLVI